MLFPSVCVLLILPLMFALLLIFWHKHFSIFFLICFLFVLGYFSPAFIILLKISRSISSVMLLYILLLANSTHFSPIFLLRWNTHIQFMMKIWNSISSVFLIIFFPRLAIWKYFIAAIEYWRPHHVWEYGRIHIDTCMRLQWIHITPNRVLLHPQRSVRISLSIKWDNWPISNFC